MDDRAYQEQMVELRRNWATLRSQIRATWHPAMRWAILIYTLLVLTAVCWVLLHG